MSALRQMALATHTAARPAANMHVRRLSAGACSSTTGPAGTTVHRCRCWPNPPCHHHATGSCGYSQFECGGGGGGVEINHSHHTAHAAAGASVRAAASLQLEASQMLAGATTQAVGILQGMLFDSERAMQMTRGPKELSFR